MYEQLNQDYKSVI